MKDHQKLETSSSNGSVWVYDLALRVFHALVALGLIAAYVIASQIDDDDPRFLIHMGIGLVLLGLAIWRLIWGFVGPQTARFASMPFHLGALLSYFRNVFSSSSRQWAGHHPASSWTLIAVLGVVFGLASTGLIMTGDFFGGKEEWEDLHELLANGFWVVAGAHVAGLVLHAWVHRDDLAWSMWTGKKSRANPQEGIGSSRPSGAIVLAVWLVIWVAMGFRNYDSETFTLSVGKYQFVLKADN